MRARLRARFLLPGMVVAAAVAGGLLTYGGAAHAAPSSEGNSGSSSGSALAAGGSSSPITYKSLPGSDVAPGKVLFDANCATCHGNGGQGSAVAPVLRGLGPATVDFWVSTGRMPLANPYKQPIQKEPRFDRQQTKEIASFVASLAPTAADYPDGIPSVDTASANLADGNSLFVLNCAACHTITGAGDALALGAFSPSLHYASKTQVAEAIRTGPDQMPHFGPGNLSNRQVADIVAYVTQYVAHPNNRGGLGLGEIGPVAEGFVGLLIGVGGLMLIAFWIGDRA